MARQDDRLTTDDLTGRRDERRDEGRDDRGGLLGALRGDRGAREDRDRDDDDRLGEPADPGDERYAGSDVTDVRTEGGHVQVERDRPPEARPDDDRADRGAGDDLDGERRALLDGGELDDFRRRWESIQAGFVDEPRRAVEEADALVAGVMQRLADSFSAERRELEDRWDRGDDIDTEALRVALQRYRSFFNRLLST